MNVRVPFNFTTWNKVVYTSGYVITYIIKTIEPNRLILILNLANKSYFIIKVDFCHLLAWFKNYDPLKVGVNSFWDTLYGLYDSFTSWTSLKIKVPLYWSQIKMCNGKLLYANDQFKKKMKQNITKTLMDHDNLVVRTEVCLWIIPSFNSTRYPIGKLLINFLSSSMVIVGKFKNNF